MDFYIFICDIINSNMTLSIILTMYVGDKSNIVIYMHDCIYIYI